jgi:pimeloyl-ACP methyl ester carboxylesterase
MTLITHYSSGAGDPVLLLNGGLMTIAAWEPIASALQPRYRVVRCDFRGQLLSPGPAPETIADHAADVTAVLDALGIESAHVVGTSFGALVGLALAATAPTRVRSLVAGTTTARMTDLEWQAALPLLDACRAAARGTGDGGRIIDLIAPVTYSTRFLETNRDMLAARRALVSTLPSAYFAGAAGIVGLLKDLDLRPLLPAIDCPTLVLAAGDDRTFPLAHSEALAAAIRGARLDVLAGAPHGVFVEDPARVVPAIARFLADRQARSAASDPASSEARTQASG